MGVTAVFLDAGYLSKVCQHNHKGARIDFGRLVQEMTAPETSAKSLTGSG